MICFFLSSCFSLFSSSCFCCSIAIIIVVVVVANKDWGPQNKLPELILEFVWCSLRASMEFSTVLKKNFGVDFWLFF